MMVRTSGRRLRGALIATLLFACMVPLHTAADVPGLSEQDNKLVSRVLIGLVQQGYPAPDVARLMAKARRCAADNILPISSGPGKVEVLTCVKPLLDQLHVTEAALRLATTNVGDWNIFRGECAPTCRTNDVGRLRVDMSGKGQAGFATGTATVADEATTTYTFFRSKDDPQTYDFNYTLVGFPDHGSGYVYWANQCFMYGVFFSDTVKDANGTPFQGIIVMQRCRV
jgi:hypothetical protein